MLMSLPAVAQQPRVGITAYPTELGENETVTIRVFRLESTPQSLAVNIAVSGTNSVIPAPFERTETIPASEANTEFEIATENISADSEITVRIVPNNSIYRIANFSGEVVIPVEDNPPPRVVISPLDGATFRADGNPVEFTLTRTMPNISQPLVVLVNVDDLHMRVSDDGSSIGLENYIAVLQADQYGDREVRFEANSSTAPLSVLMQNVPADQITGESRAAVRVRVLADEMRPITYRPRTPFSRIVRVSGNPDANNTPQDTTTPPDTPVETMPDTTTTPDNPPPDTPPDTPVETMPDTTVLMVTSVIQQNPGSSPTNANSLTWRVTFSEAAQNVDSMDFTLTGTTATTNVAPVSGQTGVYDVTASGGNLVDLDGTVTLGFAADQNIEDAEGNALTPPNLMVFEIAAYVLDNTAPMVEYILPQSLELIQGTEILFGIRPQTEDDIGSYSSNNLPAGLMVHPMTGVISGTPTMENSATTTATITVTDNAGNSAPVTVTFPMIGEDMTDPTLAFFDHLGEEDTNFPEVTWSLDFSELVQNVDTAFDVKLLDREGMPVMVPTATLQVKQNSTFPRQYDVTVEGLVGFEGTATLVLDSDQNIRDFANRALVNPVNTDNGIQTQFDEKPFRVDTVRPMVVDISDVPARASGPFTAIITFSEAVSGFEQEDFMVSNAMLSDFAPDETSGTDPHTVWSVTVTPTADGQVTLDIAENAVMDDFGNGNTAASQVMSNYFGVPYMLEQPIVGRDMLTLNFDIELDDTNPPDPAAFTVMVGTTEIEVEMVELGSVILHLAGPLPEGNNGVVKYVASASTAAGTSLLMTAGDNSMQIGDFTVRFDVVTEAEAAARSAGRPLEAYLPRFGRTVGEQAAAAVRNRISANRSAGFQGQIAGRAIGLRESGDAGQTGAHNRAVFQTLIEQGMDATSPLSTTSPSSWSLTSEEVLLGTSFAFTRDTDAGMSLGFWGQASQSGFDGHGVAGNIDGRVTGVQLGADWRQGAGLFGLMVSRSRGSSDVAGTMTAAPGEMKSDLTALVPYGGVEVSSTLSLWGAAGLGRGDVTFTPTVGVSTRTDIDWSMLTGGVRGALGNVAALGGASLDLIADALWTRTRSDALPGAPSSATSSDTTQVRAGVEASWAQVLDSGSIQTPRLSLGLRHDGGDAETGMGLEIGGGFNWRDAGGLSFGVEGRALALHDDGDYRDWGVGLNFSYDPRPDTQRGFSMVFSQGLGVSTSGSVTSLMSSGSFPTGFDGSDGESRWSVEASHGTSRGLGMVSSPYVRLSGGGGDQTRDLRLGYRIGPDVSRASDMSLDVWAEPSNNDDQSVEVGASLRWNW